MKTCEKMEKSKIVMGILAAATLGACQSSKVKISGRLVGADARQVYIEQLSAGGKARGQLPVRIEERPLHPVALHDLLQR